MDLRSNVRPLQPLQSQHGAGEQFLTVFLFNNILGSVQVKRGNIRYALEMVRPWWRFWRPEDRIYHDVADHEWTTWKTTSGQVGVFVLLYPVLRHGLAEGFPNRVGELMVR